MQGAIARVCMVVAAILNHPLHFPQENSTLPEQDDEVMARMREHEEMLEKEQARLERELSELENKSEDPSSDDRYGWYVWGALSLVVFIAIEMCRMDLADAEMRPIEDEDVLSESGSISARTMAIDKNILSRFCDRCTHASSHENWRVREFVEGFADDLLESLKSVCNWDVDMEVGDFIGVGSMFESWKLCKPLMCDLLVPFSPPEPFSFQFHLWSSRSSAVPPDMQGCGRIEVSRLWEDERSCLCSSANLGDDVLCLVHCRKDGLKADNPPIELLCSKNTPYLDKDQVMKWFQISLTKAWARISHKRDFEVTFRNLDAAGALTIRFRSGKVVVMNIIPSIRLEDTDAYFVSHFPSDCDSSPDPYWPLSLAVYERNLLKHFTKRLPEHSCHLLCLQIVTFLHRKQTGLTGKSALTNYHLKTALLHQLLNQSPCVWGMEQTEHRLRDVLHFLQRSLQEKRLHHVLIGNSKVPKEIQLPEMFGRTQPLNLFRSMVLQRKLHAATVRHFQEMLKNAHVLIQEYMPLMSNGAAYSRRDSL